MNDPLHFLKNASAPQRSGFREQLEHQILAATITSHPTPMSHRLLKYLLAAPVLVGAAYALVFSLNQSHLTPTNWTATEVQAAVVKSIAETFADIQDDHIHYQKFSRQSSGSDGIYQSTDETWHAGLNSASIETTGADQTVSFAGFGNHTNPTEQHTCLYAPGGITYDGINGGYTTPTDFDCSDNTVTENPFTTSAGTDLGLSTFVTDSDTTDHYIILQWNTTEAITDDIDTSIIKEKSDSTAVNERQLTPLVLTGPYGQPTARPIPEEFLNQANGNEFKQSIYLPDLAYSEKYESTALPITLYFQISYQDVTSVVYEYDVASQKITIPDADQLKAVEDDYQTKYLLQQKAYNVDNDIAKDSQERLSAVKDFGTLVNYSRTTVDGKMVLEADYKLTDDVPTLNDGVKPQPGTYHFTIDTASQQIMDWSYTNPQGSKDTITIEANTTLSDDPTAFFTEAHWRQMLSDHGVK